jgi:glucose-1-phosphate thymidylyltransferase
VEEVSWRNGWLTNAELSDLADPLVKSGYGAYLHQVLAEGRARA